MAASRRAVSYSWEFLPRFRAHALGWNGSHAGIERLHQAVAEIKLVAEHEPATAAEGVVRLMERIWPAFEGIDTSSGALGSSVAWACAEVAPIFAAAPLSAEARDKLLERLWEAVQEDGVDFLWMLEDLWGEVCGSKKVASAWADRMLPMVRQSWSGGGYFNGTSICLSSLLAAERYDEILEALSVNERLIWPWKRYGVRALVAQGKVGEAIAYAESCRQPGYPDPAVDAECESILLAAGRSVEAYERYAMGANEANTGLATFRQIVKKYPDIDARRILDDLAQASGEPGRWFAAAKTAGFLDLALQFARKGRTDPKTLSRAARDFLKSDPAFALRIGRLAVERIMGGYGYEITEVDFAEALERYLAVAMRMNAERDAATDLRRMLTDYPNAPVYFRSLILRRVGK